MRARQAKALARMAAKEVLAQVAKDAGLPAPGAAPDPPAPPEEKPEEALSIDDLEFEVAYAGRHQASTGEAVITVERLQRIADITNQLIQAGELKVPMTLGHGEDQEKLRALFPEQGAPALGWIEGLEMRGDRLWAKAKKVNRRFWEAVRNGFWRTRSPVIRRVDDAMLELAWLGATAPAMPGLQDVFQFNAPLTRVEFSHVGPEPEPEKPEEAGDAPKEEAPNMNADSAIKLTLDLAIKGRKILPGQRDKEEAFCTKLAGDGEQLQAYLDSILERPELPDPTKPVAAIGETKEALAEEDENEEDEDERSPIEREADELMAKNKDLSFADAICLAAAKDETTTASWLDAAALAGPGRIKDGGRPVGNLARRAFNEGR